MILAVLAPVLAPAFASLAASLPSWLSWLPTAYSALGNAGWAVSAGVGLGVGYVVDADSASAMVEKIGGAVGDVGAAAGNAGSKVVSSLLTSPAGLLLLGGAAYLLLRKRD